MFLDPFVIATLLGSIFLLSVTVAFLYHIYSRDKHFEEQRSHMAQDSQKIIEDAHLKAKHIIEQAIQRAHDTLTETDMVKKDILHSLDKDLHNVSTATVEMLKNETLDFGKEYKQILEELKTEHAQILSQAQGTLDEVEILKKKLLDELSSKTANLADETVKRLDEETAEISHEYRETMAQTVQQYREKAFATISQIEQIPEEELKDFRDILRQETVASQQVLSKRINEAFDGAQAEIEEYKKAQIEKIDKSVQKVAEKVIEQVLADSMSPEDHVKLIQAALEQAKKDKVFDLLGRTPS